MEGHQTYIQWIFGYHLNPRTGSLDFSDHISIRIMVYATLIAKHIWPSDAVLIPNPSFQNSGDLQTRKLSPPLGSFFLSPSGKIWELEWITRWVGAEGEESSWKENSVVWRYFLVNFSDWTFAACFSALCILLDIVPFQSVLFSEVKYNFSVDWAIYNSTTSHSAKNRWFNLFMDRR